MIAALLCRRIVLSFVLLVTTVVLYYPTHRHPFVRYDDNEYVYENPHVQGGLTWESVRWAFTSSRAANWHPLTWLSHASDCQIFGLKPAGPHDENILLHAGNAVLLFWILLQATGYTWRSFMVAALFALHPINVESVVWIAERKNLLSMTFFLLALAAYRWYASRPRLGPYVLVSSLFALGLMAKPQVITLPCVLLLWDYWPLRRMFPSQPDETEVADTIPPRSLLWLVLEKLPLFVLVVASAIVTLHVQEPNRMFYPRLLCAGNGIVSYVVYVGKAIWPTRLAPFYPHPEHLSALDVSLSALFLLLITLLVVIGRRHRYLPVGWFWFLGTLVPMLGIVQVGMQAMADRYAYLSFIGLFIMVCWGVAESAERMRLPSGLLLSSSVAILLFFAIISRRQIDYWKTDEALWTHTLEVTSNNWVAETQLGCTLAMDGRVKEGVPHLYKAIATNPDNSTANMGIAIYLLQVGDFHDAIIFYQRVVQDKRQHASVLANAWVGMAKAYRSVGDKAKMNECLEAGKRVQNGSREEN